MVQGGSGWFKVVQAGWFRGVQSGSGWFRVVTEWLQSGYREYRPTEKFQVGEESVELTPCSLHLNQ